MTRIAIYAGYSTDKQREAAIEDQARNCRRIAELLAGIKAELMAPEYLTEFKREVRALLATLRSARDADREVRAQRVAQLEREIANLIEAIGSGLLSPALKAKLAAAETEHAELTSRRQSEPNETRRAYLVANTGS